MAQCLAPVSVYSDKYKKLINVPCGKCLACCQRNASAWFVRLKNELRYAHSAHFVTLTYSSNTVPISEDGLLQLVPRDLNLYHRRLRMAGDRAKLHKLRYYSVGEYGGRTMRPHYHSIMFNSTPELIVDQWKCPLTWHYVSDEDGCAVQVVDSWQSTGHVYIGDVNDSSIGYVTGYVKKSLYSDWCDEKRQRPFSVMSKYLGVQYITPAVLNWHKADLQNRMYIPMDGIKLPMPRYYKELLYQEEEREKMALVNLDRAAQKAFERSQYLIDHYGDRAASVMTDMQRLVNLKIQNKKQKRNL